VIGARSGNLLDQTVGDQGLAIGAIVIFVDEEKLSRLRKTYEPELAALGKPAPCGKRSREVTPMHAEPFRLQLATWNAELAGRLRRVRI
jgi:hypothetical protein